MFHWCVSFFRLYCHSCFIPLLKKDPKTLVFIVQQLSAWIMPPLEEEDVDLNCFFEGEEEPSVDHFLEMVILTSALCIHNTSQSFCHNDYKVTNFRSVLIFALSYF